MNVSVCKLYLGSPVWYLAFHDIDAAFLPSLPCPILPCPCLPFPSLPSLSYILFLLLFVFLFFVFASCDDQHMIQGQQSQAFHNVVTIVGCCNCDNCDSCKCDDGRMQMPCITVTATACCVAACRYQYWLAADGQQSKAQSLSEQCNEDLQQASHS